MAEFSQFNRVGRSRYGMVVYNMHDTCIGRSIEEYHEYAEREAAIFDQILKEGDLVIEAGANVGAQTLLLAHCVGETGRVLAFEPQRIVYQALCGTLAINSIPNVFCWNMALGAELGEAVLPEVKYSSTQDFASIVPHADDEGEAVPQVTIDSLNLPLCSLLKIGIEEGALQIVQGARETIEKHKPLLYLQRRTIAPETELLQLLDELGYSLYWHDSDLFNPENLAGKNENVFTMSSSRNLLGVEKSAEKKLTGFEEVAVPKAA